MLLVLLGAIGAPGCHKDSPIQAGPVPDPVVAPVLQCGESVALTTSSSTVTSSIALYPSPTITGGTQPVNLMCSPESGTVFVKGATAVTCVATDSIQRQATCGLTVTVNVPAPPVPVLQGTKFLAFGDSLTRGENGCDDFCAESSIQNIIPGHEYPTLLQQLLAARYTTQNVVVVESGKGGETAQQGSDRLPAELANTSPDALLLLEGVNDFHPANGRTEREVIDSLRQDIGIAKAAGVKQVFLSTLPPELEDYRRNWGLPYLDTVNAMIRDLAAQEKVVLVDTFAALSTNPTLYISSNQSIDPEKYPGESDGLHLTYAGRMKLAQTFADAIQKNFEVQSTGMAPARAALRRR